MVKKIDLFINKIQILSAYFKPEGSRELPQLLVKPPLSSSLHQWNFFFCERLRNALIVRKIVQGTDLLGNGKRRPE